MTVLTREQEQEITSAGSATFGARLREAGLEGRTIGSLTGRDAAAFQGAVQAGLDAEGRVRESAGLIDLGGEGVPTVSTLR